MTETRPTFCTRCRAVALEDVTRLTVQAGPIRQAGNIDISLCKDCGERFGDFLKHASAGAFALATR